MNSLKITEEIFKTEVLIIWNCSKVEVNKYLKKNKYKYFVEGGCNVDGSVIRSKNDLYRIIWCQKISHKNNGVLVHELFHLIVRILNDKGVPIIPNIQTGECGDETAAYLFEYYYNTIMRKVK